MQQNIKYTGLATTPSDYDSPDGQLATAIGLVNEDGALKGVQQPKVISQTTALANNEILFLHTTDSYDHYIILNHPWNTTVYNLHWADKEDIDSGNFNTTYFYSTGEERATHVCAIGNTLIVTTPTYLLYFLWQNNNYLFLGNQLPKLEMSFGLNGVLRESQQVRLPEDPTVYIDGDASRFPYNNGETRTPRGVAYVSVGLNASYEERDPGLSEVMSQINAYITERTKANEFVFPFMVRCAYRMYDGTLVRHTSPVLMLTCSDCIPKALVKRNTPYERGNVVFYVISAIGNNLDYAFLGDLSELNKWKDIIQSVDIFVSRPFYTIDINKNPETLSNKVHTQGRYTGINTVVEQYKYGYIWPCLTASTTDIEIDLPPRSIKKDIEDCSEFRLIHSIPINKLQASSNVASRHTITLENDVLATLSTREVMNMDYEMYDRLSAGNMNVQNNRLTLIDIKRNLANPYRPEAFVPYTTTNENEYLERCAYVAVEVDGEERILKSTSVYNKSGVPDAPWTYLYYPDPNAKKIILKKYTPGETPYYLAYPLRVHDNLNGAFFFQGDNPITVNTPTVSANPPVPMRNKIYVSEEGNPFVFALTSRHNLPVHEVMATAMATKALSQGQFGQFPLYAFTTEGVWALEVAADGTYSAMHPVSRDVCTNVASITQIDNAVLFVTDRGIMLLQGSDTVCITDGILGDSPFDPAELPHLDEVANDINGYHVVNAPMTHDFLAGCRMIYDYMHQHIIVFNPETTTSEEQREVPKYPYAHVYSLKSKLWGMMQSDLASTVNSYPDALAITRDRQLVSFASSEEQSVKGLLVTRPFKLGAPDAYKTIHNVVQRGVFHKGNVKTLLYGSRDLYNWHLVGSSVDHWLRGLRGTPFKYFRIALLTDLAPGESISGATVAFETKETNKMH